MVDLFRRDRTDKISAPNLDDTSSYAEHVVHARGKRTRYTSVSSSVDAIRDFGDQLWKLVQPKVTQEGHVIVHHEDLLRALRDAVRSDDFRSRELASRAIPRVLRRREAIVDWHFDVSGVDRKDRMSWAESHVREYFARC